MSSLLALPLSGTAARLIFRALPKSPAMRVLELFGTTLTDKALPEEFSVIFSCIYIREFRLK